MGADEGEDRRPLQVHPTDHSLLCDMGRVGAVCSLLGHQVGAAEAGPQDGEACEALFVTFSGVMSCDVCLSHVHCSCVPIVYCHIERMNRERIRQLKVQQCESIFSFVRS